MKAFAYAGTVLLALSAPVLGGFEDVEPYAECTRGVAIGPGGRETQLTCDYTPPPGFRGDGTAAAGMGNFRSEDRKAWVDALKNYSVATLHRIRAWIAKTWAGPENQKEAARLACAAEKAREMNGRIGQLKAFDERTPLILEELHNDAKSGFDSGLACEERQRLGEIAAHWKRKDVRKTLEWGFRILGRQIKRMQMLAEKVNRAAEALEAKEAPSPEARAKAEKIKQDLSMQLFNGMEGVATTTWHLGNIMDATQTVADFKAKIEDQETAVKEAESKIENTIEEWETVYED